MDFVHHQLATGRKIGGADDPRFDYRGEDIVKILDKVCVRIDYTATIHVHQGTEFVSRDLDLYAYTRESFSSSRGRSNRLTTPARFESGDARGNMRSTSSARNFNKSSVLAWGVQKAESKFRCA
jgi:hypothetical protein